MHKSTLEALASKFSPKLSAYTRVYMVIDNEINSGYGTYV